jgi:tetratricopeptide (TPR) repeat protein
MIFKYLKIFIFLISLCCVACSNFTLNKTQQSSISYNYNKPLFDSLFIEADKNFLLNNYIKSFTIYNQCLRINPQSSACYYQLSNIFYGSQKYQQGIYYSRKALYYDNTNDNIILQLAKLYQSINKYDSAIYFNKLILPKYSSNPDFVLNLSNLYISNHQYKIALQLLNKYQSVYGLNEDISIGLYKLYRYLNRNTSCVKLLKESIHKFKDDTRFYGLLGGQFLTLNKVDSAIFYFKKMELIDPSIDKGCLLIIDFYKTKNDSLNCVKYSSDFFFNLNFAPEDKYELLNYYCNDSLYVHNYSNIINVYANFLCTKYPQDLKFKLSKIDYLTKSDLLLEARDSLISLINHFDLNYPIYEKLLLICNRFGDFTNLRYYSSLACKKFSNLPYPYFFNGVANYYLKNYQNSIDTLQLGILKNIPNNRLTLRFYTFLGENYQALNDFDKSSYYFEKALLLDPENLYILNNYSYYLSLRGSYLDKALNYISICLKYYPQSSTYLDTYGWILYKSGKISEAKEAVYKALLNSSNADLSILEHYCEILLKLGDLAEAVKYYHLYLSKGGNSDYLKTLFDGKDY